MLAFHNDVISQTPNRFQDLDGIGPQRPARVVAAWAEHKVIHDSMVFPHSHGVSTARVVCIYKTYDTEAIARVQEPPYRLALDMHGIGVKTADTLAQRLGIPRDAAIRTPAGVRPVLQSCADEGHCAVIQTALRDAATTWRDIPETTMTQAITLAVQEERRIAESIDGSPCLVLAPLSRAAVGVATPLRHRLACVTTSVSMLSMGMENASPGQGGSSGDCQHASHGTTWVDDTRAGEALPRTSPLDAEAGASQGAHAAVSPRRIA